MPEQQPITPPIQFDAQITDAHVLQALGEFKSEVNARFDTLEGQIDAVAQKVDNAGLNGHTPLLKKFLEGYAAEATSKQAWRTVRADLAGRFRWLLPGRHWVALILAGALGAVGWQVGAALFGIHVSLP